MRSRLTLIAALATAALAPAGALASELESFDLPSPRAGQGTVGGILGDGRTVPKVNVLLPDGYEAGSDRRWPVLWLLHGANGGTDDWLPGITELAAGVPAIVVMPDGGKFGMYMDWWNGGARSGPAWTTYHLKVLRREIDRRYPIRAGRRWHTIGGISMGGQGTLRYAAMLPGYFGSAVGMSAAVPNMQSETAQFGVGLLAPAGATGVTYETIFGPAGAAYAEGNSPQALAANLSHSRLYLTSGNGVNCPEDPANPNSFALDVITESCINRPAGAVRVSRRRRGRRRDRGDDLRRPHLRRLGPRLPPRRRELGVLRAGRRAPERVELPDDRPQRRDLGASLPLRRAARLEIAGFERSGRTLTATGSGEVRIRGGPGCRFIDELPFVRGLPRACLGPSS